MQFSAQIDGCKGVILEPSRFKRLAHAASSFQLAPILSKLAASSLVIASAGLGAVYAWGVGIEHGAILGSLFVLFAVGLEIAKPLSVVAAFKALSSWQVVRGGVLALLAIVAITYSLSAELSLMATARGDRVAERAATSNIAIKARDRYQRAELELDRLAVARPSVELQSQIDGVLSDPRSGGCVALNGPFTREHCFKVVEWKAEQGRALRRAELEGTMREAERDMASGPTSRAADPGASSLATYLGALGFIIPVAVLTDWLSFVPVLALEIGSALAGVLVQAVSPSPLVRCRIRPRLEVYEAIEEQPVVHVGHGSKTEPSDDTAHAREKVKNAIMSQLKDQGGEVAGSERGLAALIGTSRPTVRRAINGLVLAGLIAAEATRNGTMLRLVA